MKTISVRASRAYEVLIGTQLLPKLGQFAAALKKCGKAAIISDSNVWPIYGQTVTDSLSAAGFQPIHFVFPAGESSKNLQTYGQIVTFLAEHQLTRSDLVIALGGGVVGDMTGFAAATYLRGISYIQIPTTLLSMVDSSVGGKTAIDLSMGKNLVGAFYQPAMVLCDIDSLQSLPRSIFIDGCAEVIKYGILYDETLFSHLRAAGLAFDREYVIARCVELKRDVVTEDEFDTGARQKLNLGHTVGHGVEACSEYTLSHGRSVAIGMAIVARIAATTGLCSKETADAIHAILAQFSLPTVTEYTADRLFKCALSDKKRSGSMVNLILPRTIGECIIQSTPVAQLQSMIEAGL